MPRDVVVVGMPRSGTSLTAAAFARQGYYVGPVKRERYREGDEHNPFGYFEADELVKRNAQLFHRAGFPHHNTWLFDRMPPAVHSRVHTLSAQQVDHDLVANYRDRAPWLWKDPRLTVTIGYWLPLLAPSDPAFIVTRRQPGAIVNSFQRMGWPVPADLVERVHEHVRWATEALDRHGVEYLVIDYEDYFVDPDAVATRLCQHTGVPIHGSDLNVRADLDHTRNRSVRERLIAPAQHLPVGLRRTVRRLLPETVLRSLRPELRHTPRSEEERRRRGTPERRD